LYLFLIRSYCVDSISYDPATSILFASFKYTGSDFDGDMRRTREHPPTREWWATTDAYQQSLNPGAVSSEKGGTDDIPGWWKELEEVFYVA
jgi:L-rhamnose mutarotase